ncbi:hypothetical protein L1987_02194 [Smallanthus sonchifolius]|uniref:Uncharacterized protein n=1 Tax=Smallanthus sonchifolius TaxID=185202 RepID=A0ACB9K744_9ASTR|nr:hypothetical protein L1987_02194 [Smallanthus sonchifolius]
MMEFEGHRNDRMKNVPKEHKGSFLEVQGPSHQLHLLIVMDQLNSDFIFEPDNINGVSRWLEGVGFGRYAGMPEMHKVDEEVLPLLSRDGLKEMYALAVGARRNPYAAICLLKGK